MKTLQLHKPHFIVIVGLPGAGKTFFARQFAETFNTPYVDYGHYQKIVGDQEVGDIVATEVLGQLILTQQTILIEGRGETKQDRIVLSKLARSKGYEILFIWIQTEPQTTHKRAVKAKDAAYSEEEYAERAEAFRVLEPSEPHIVISGRHTYASQARVVLKKLIITRTATATRTVVPPRPNNGRGYSGRMVTG